MSLDTLLTKFKAGVPVKYNFIMQAFLSHIKYFAKQIQATAFENTDWKYIPGFQIATKC